MEVAWIDRPMVVVHPPNNVSYKVQVPTLVNTEDLREGEELYVETQVRQKVEKRPAREDWKTDVARQAKKAKQDPQGKASSGTVDFRSFGTSRMPKDGL